MTIHWKAVGQYFIGVLVLFQYVILENLSILELALSGVKELIIREYNFSDHIPISHELDLRQALDTAAKLQNTRPHIYKPLNNNSIHCYILRSTKDSDTCK